MRKEYIIRVLVDETTLRNVAEEVDPSNKNADITELITGEMSWVNQSGISVISVQEVNPV